MARQYRARLIVSALVTALLLAQGTPAQESMEQQRVIAKELLAADAGRRAQALAVARALGPTRTGPELGAALITALERENAVSRARAEAALKGETLPERDELYFDVAELVVGLRDRRAIPALAGAIDTGMMVIRALVTFGEVAAPTVLAVAASPESPNSAVGGALWTLKLMVEGADARPLSKATLLQMRRVARQRLTGQQFDTTLFHAVELAAALGDADLRQIVERLASDWNEVAARGVTDPQRAEHLQRRANAALARWGGPGPVKR